MTFRNKAHYSLNSVVSSLCEFFIKVSFLQHHLVDYHVLNLASLIDNGHWERHPELQHLDIDHDLNLKGSGVGTWTAVTGLVFTNEESS
jgi:hypothetical protein